MVCLPLQSGGDGGAPMGTLTVGYSSPPSAPTLKQAVVVARALASEHQASLHDFHQLVSSMLLPQPRHTRRSGGAGPLGRRATSAAAS